MASVSLDFSTKTHFFYGFSNLEPHRDEPLGSKFLIIYTGAFTEKQRTGSKSEWGKKLLCYQTEGASDVKEIK